MLPGPAQLKTLKAFVPSLATYGVAAGAVVVYMASEWKGKDLLQFVPIYNRYERNIPDLNDPFYMDIMITIFRKYTAEKDRDM